MKLNLILFLLLVTGSLYAQKISYKILEENPDKAYTNFVAPGIGFEYNATNISVSLGAAGRYNVTEAIALEGNMNYDVVQINGTGAGFLVEAGLFLPLKTTESQKEVPIVLSYNPYAGRKYENGKAYNIEETKYIRVPQGRYVKQFGIRGGIHNRNTGVENLTGTLASSIFLSGIYVGGQMTNQTYIKTLVNDDVERIGAGFGRFYVDAIFFPVSNLGDENITTGDIKSDGSFGWRVGYQWYVSPHDGDYHYLGRSVFSAELGQRPYAGFMFNVTWGWTVFNR